MIFTPHNADLVRRGLKTRTRRIMRPGDYWDEKTMAAYNLKPRRGMDAQRMRKWQIGHWYAIQEGRGKKSTGEFIVVDIKQERLTAITRGEIKREGYGSIEEFIEDWDRMHPKDTYISNPWVWVLRIEI